MRITTIARTLSKSAPLAMLVLLQPWRATIYAPRTATLQVPSAAAPAAPEFSVGARIGDWLLRPAVLAALAAGAALAVALWQFPFDLFIFRASWLLHPQEQEHLRMARNLAHEGTLYLRDPWFGQSLAHLPEDSSYVDGAFVPRSPLLVYAIYAVPFLFSDTAWLFVTPFFTLVAMVFASLIVLRRSGSRWAAAIAVVLFITTAPILLNASGLAFENIIAVAFLLGGVLALDHWSERSSMWAALAAGMAFALAAAIRPDMAPGALIASGYVVLIVALRVRKDGFASNRASVWSAVALATMFAIGALSVMGANRVLYGSALESGYGGQAWQGSADGVGERLMTFDPLDFLRMSRAFLFEIGKVQTALLVLGVAALATRRLLRPGDVALLATGAFLAVLHLGHDGVTGGARSYLVNSTPRYLQPLYVAGVVLGSEALYRWWRSLSLDSVVAKRALLVSLVALASALGLAEAYDDTWAIPSAATDTSDLRKVQEFAQGHPGAVFIGDYATKGIINGHTLIPRYLETPGDLTPFVKDELQRGTTVYIVDLPRMRQPSNGYYSGYVEALERAGYHSAPVSDASGFLQVVEQQWTDDDVRRFVERNLSEPWSDPGLTNPRLELDETGRPTGWQANGHVALAAADGGLRIMNEGEYGGVRQRIEAHDLAGQTVTIFVAVRTAKEDPADGVIIGLYHDGSQRLIAEKHVAVSARTSYVVFETFVAKDAPLRLVIASEHEDAGDLVIEGALLKRSSLAALMQGPE